MPSTLNKVLATLPAILLVTFANVAIAFITASVILIQLISNGVNKHLSLMVSIVVAIAVHLYIIFNHKLRNYIKNQGQSNE